MYTCVFISVGYQSQLFFFILVHFNFGWCNRAGRIMPSSPTIIKNAINAEKMPLSEDEVASLISHEIEQSTAVNEIITKLLNKISEKSSKFKAVVNASTIKFSELDSESNEIDTKFGSLWDTGKDGLYNLKFKLHDGSYLLVTIVFIYI